MATTLSDRADLHRHLDGSLRPATLAELAARAGRDVPANLVFTPGMGLAAALARFELTLSVMRTPDAVERIAAETCEDAAADGVVDLEIRFAPQLHVGAPIEAIVDAAIEGCAGRAGIILCGLYGEAPSVLAKLVEVAVTRKGVVGIDLAGGPRSGDSWSLADYAPAFRHAADVGLGRTVHAGEGRPPREILDAIELLRAERIGHGTTLLDDAAIADTVLRRGITLEACPTSNVQTGVVASLAEHPLPKWLAMGIRACICPDNTLFSDVTSSEEHRRARAMPTMTDALLEKAIAFGRAAKFARR
jgi:adenosine deaminase